jgi:DNA-binding response OmpR family regulator
MIAKVLVVDDNRELTDLLCEQLTKHGYQSIRAAEGFAALRLARSERPDLVILDLMLPGLGGLEVCRRLRQDPETAAVPILILSAKGEELDRVLGLEVGADDYVSKPFSVREVLARVNAILRRQVRGQTPVPALRVGELEIDEARHEAKLAGAPLDLSAREFGLLHALVEANGRVLTRDQLFSRLNGGDAAAHFHSRTVDMHVSRLRRKLGAEGGRIVTVRDVGYRFES